MKNEEIGKLLKELRIKHGLTQLELANKVNVTYQAVSRWEKGINTPNLVTLVALRDLYQISIDELLIQVKSKVEVIPKDFIPHWMIRYFLLTILLMVFSFGLSQFYFFLNVPYAMIITAIFFGLILSILMVVIKVRHRGFFFLITIASLIIINGTVYFTNQRYYQLSEVPHYIEVDTIKTGLDLINKQQMFLPFNLNDESHILGYHEGVEGLYIYHKDNDLSSSFVQIDTLGHVVDSITILGEKAYFTSYSNQTEGSMVYQFDLQTHEMTLIAESQLKMKVISNQYVLYFYEDHESIFDYYSVFYTLNGTDFIPYQSFEFDVLDMIYHPYYQQFYVSIYRDLEEGPGLFHNIVTLDNGLVYLNQIFGQDQMDAFELKIDGIRVISSLDHEIIQIYHEEVRHIGLYGDPYGWYDTGVGYIFHGDLIDGDYEILSQTMYYKPNFQPWGAEYMIFREYDSNFYAINREEISLVRNYSRQIEEIWIPLKFRHIIFWGTMPILAVFMTLGTKITYVPKKMKFVK